MAFVAKPTPYADYEPTQLLMQDPSTISARPEKGVFVRVWDG